MALFHGDERSAIDLHLTRNPSTGDVFSRAQGSAGAARRVRKGMQWGNDAQD
jgi:hypothetical protein